MKRILFFQLFCVCAVARVYPMLVPLAKLGAQTAISTFVTSRAKVDLLGSLIAQLPAPVCLQQQILAPHYTTHAHKSVAGLEFVGKTLVTSYIKALDVPEPTRHLDYMHRSLSQQPEFYSHGYLSKNIQELYAHQQVPNNQASFEQLRNADMDTLTKKYVQVGHSFLAGTQDAALTEHGQKYKPMAFKVVLNCYIAGEKKFSITPQVKVQVEQVAQAFAAIDTSNIIADINNAVSISHAQVATTTQEVNKTIQDNSLSSAQEQVETPVTIQTLCKSAQDVTQNARYIPDGTCAKQLSPELLILKKLCSVSPLDESFLTCWRNAKELKKRIMADTLHVSYKQRKYAKRIVKAYQQYTFDEDHMARIFAHDNLWTKLSPAQKESIRHSQSLQELWYRNLRARYKQNNNTTPANSQTVPANTCICCASKTVNVDQLLITPLKRLIPFLLDAKNQTALEKFCQQASHELFTSLITDDTVHDLIGNMTVQKRINNCSDVQLAYIFENATMDRVITVLKQCPTVASRPIIATLLEHKMQQLTQVIISNKDNSSELNNYFMPSVYMCPEIIPYSSDYSHSSGHRFTVDYDALGPKSLWRQSQDNMRDMDEYMRDRRYAGLRMPLETREQQLDARALKRLHAGDISTFSQHASDALLVAQANNNPRIQANAHAQKRLLSLPIPNELKQSILNVISYPTLLSIVKKNPLVLRDSGVQRKCLNRHAPKRLQELCIKSMLPECLVALVKQTPALLDSNTVQLSVLASNHTSALLDTVIEKVDTHTLSIALIGNPALLDHMSVKQRVSTNPSEAQIALTLLPAHQSVALLQLAPHLLLHYPAQNIISAKSGQSAPLADLFALSQAQNKFIRAHNLDTTYLVCSYTDSQQSAIRDQLVMLLQRTVKQQNTCPQQALTSLSTGISICSALNKLGAVSKAEKMVQALDAFSRYCGTKTYEFGAGAVEAFTDLSTLSKYALDEFTYDPIAFAQKINSELGTRFIESTKNILDLLVTEFNLTASLYQAQTRHMLDVNAAVAEMQAAFEHYKKQPHSTAAIVRCIFAMNTHDWGKFTGNCILFSGIQTQILQWAKPLLADAQAVVSLSHLATVPRVRARAWNLDVLPALEDSAAIKVCSGRTAPLPSAHLLTTATSPAITTRPSIVLHECHTATLPALSSYTPAVQAPVQPIATGTLSIEIVKKAKTPAARLSYEEHRQFLTEKYAQKKAVIEQQAIQELQITADLQMQKAIREKAQVAKKEVDNELSRKLANIQKGQQQNQNLKLYKTEVAQGLTLKNMPTVTFDQFEGLKISYSDICKFIEKYKFVTGTLGTDGPIARIFKYDPSTTKDIPIANAAIAELQTAHILEQRGEAILMFDICYPVADEIGRDLGFKKSLIEYDIECSRLLVEVKDNKWKEFKVIESEKMLEKHQLKNLDDLSKISDQEIKKITTDNSDILRYVWKTLKTFLMQKKLAQIKGKKFEIHSHKPLANNLKQWFIDQNFVFFEHND